MKASASDQKVHRGSAILILLAPKLCERPNSGG